MADATKVRARLEADTRQYEMALKSASKHTTAVDDSLKKTQKTAGMAGASWAKMGAAITVAGGIAVIQLKKAVAAASNLNESTTKMRVIFGSASKDIEKFAQTSATSLGMSKRAAYDAASMMATFGKAAGLTGQQLTKFSTEMVTLSSDLASFYNSSPEEAMQAIGSALRGETESIRRYGVLIDAAVLSNRALEMGIISNIKTALTPQQKALAAQAEILAQTADAQGDFARTSDGLANSQRQMAGAMEDASAALGEALLPVMAKGVKAVAAVAEAFAGLPAPVRDTAAGLALTAAAVATLGPATVGAVKGVKSMADGIKAYTTVTTTATVATDALTASSVRLGGSAGVAGVAKLSLVIGGLVTAAGLGVGAVVMLKRAIDSDAAEKEAARIKVLASSYLDAMTAGRDLNEVLKFNVLGADVAGGGMAFLAQQVAKFGPEADSVRLSMAALDAALASAAPADAAAVMDDLRASFAQSGVAVADLNGMLPTYTAMQKDAGGAAEEQTTAEKEKADAIKASNDAQQKALDIITGYINAQMAAAGSADALLGAEDRMSKVRLANLKELTGKKKEASAADREHAKSLTDTTAAAVANRDMLRSEMGLVLANANAKVEAAKASGADTVQAYEIGTEAIKKGKKALIEAAEAAGYDEEQVRKLLKQYTLIPPDAKTDIEATGVTRAMDEIIAWKKMLASIDPVKITTVILRSRRDEGSTGGAKNAASGGKVVGPGTGTSDTAGVYALSNGEWVVPADSARKLGDGFMAALVDGTLPGMATGGKVKPLTAAQKKAAAAKKKRDAEAAAKKRAAAAKAKRDAALEDIEWQYQMDLISLPQKIAAMQKQLKSRKPGSQEYKDLQLDIYRDQKTYRGEQEDDAARAAAEEQEQAARAQQEAAEAQERAAAAAQKAAEDQQAAAEQLKAKADGIASSMVSALGLGQTQANGKKWSTSAMLGDFANRAKQARDFAGMVADLSGRGLSEEVINQVLSAGPVAGADMARALSRMSAGQLATVNQNQGAINAAGQWLGNALTYGNNNAITVTLSGGAPVVLQLDSRAIYEGQLTLARQMGGTYALTGR